MNRGVGETDVDQAPTVLLVDDEPFNIRVLKLKFQNAGYRVITAGNGKEGLDRFESEHPDVVISDVNMPVMDGREMCRRLPDTGTYLLMVVTSSVEDERRTWASAMSRVVFIEKPASPRSLVERANQYIREHRRVENRSDAIETATTGEDPADVQDDGTAAELATRYEELNLIYKIGQRFRLDDRVEQTLTDQMEETVLCLDGDVGIMVVKGKHLLLDWKTCSGFDVFLSETDLVCLKRAIGSHVREHRRIAVIEDTQTVSALKALPSMRLLIAPVCPESDEAVGFMAVLRDGGKRNFSTGDRRLVTVLAGHAGIVVRNQEICHEVKQTLFDVIESLSATIEAKLTGHQGHGRRVAQHALTVGQSMGLSMSDLERLRWCAVLHDLGKAEIVEPVFDSSRPPPPEEDVVVKSHVEKGYRSLEHIRHFNDVRLGILHHHERFDGTGYPGRLKGTDIPLYARILAVADAYDAITQRSAARPAQAHDLALREIGEGAGTQFDPEIVGIFMRLITERTEHARAA